LLQSRQSLTDAVEKVFSGWGTKFYKAMRGEVRDDVASQKNNHGASYRRRQGLQSWSRPKIKFGEIFEVVRFSTFLTVSTQSDTSLASIDAMQKGLFDHLVGGREHPRRHLDAERSRRLPVSRGGVASSGTSSAPRWHQRRRAALSLRRTPAATSAHRQAEDEQ
jgi:hypothetical protein